MTEQLNFLFHLLAVWPEVAYLASLRLTCLISDGSDNYLPLQVLQG